jgi:hypothetical protein
MNDEKRTSSYVTTLNTNCPYYPGALKVMRKYVSSMNKLGKGGTLIKGYRVEDSSKARVIIRGRDPKVIPEGKNRYDYCGNIVGGIANANRVDVYILQR